MSEDANDKFTFSVEGKEYVINEKSNSRGAKKNTIHGPSIIIGVAITAICVIGIFFSLNVNNIEESQLIERELIETTTTPEPTEISLKTLINNGSPILGDPNAPITLIEFGDFQCHFCNVHFHNTEPALLENFVTPGKVNIIFKDYTIIGNDSVFAAHGAHCASEQAKYWEYHGVLFNNWTGENNGWAAKPNLVSFANALNIDTQEFVQCMNSNRYNDIITQSKIDGELLGIRGTPAFFIINDNTGEVQSIYGAQPYETFEKVFDFILEN